MSNARVSVGMPVYNAGGFLTTALDGILGQTFGDFELVIADNCSTDGSDAVCEEYARRDPRIRFYRNPRNLGANGNFTRVCLLAENPYFMWASANDYVAPTFLEKAVAVLDARPDVVLCVARPRYFAGDPSQYREVDDPMHIDMEAPLDRFRAVLDRITINNAMHGLVRREALRAVMPLGSYFSSDNVLVAELALSGKFHQLSEPLYYRRFEQSAATTMMTPEELRAFYLPGRKSRMRFQVWKLHVGYWNVLRRAPLAARERLRLAKQLGRMLYWDGPKLLRDVGEALRVVRPRA